MARSSKAGGEASTPLIIALVFFVLTTIGLGVMYYLAQKDIADANTAKGEAETKSKTADTEMKKAQDVAKMYRGFLGTATPDEQSYLSNPDPATKDAVRDAHGKLLAAVNTKVTEAANKERVAFEKFGQGFNLAAVELFQWDWPQGGNLPSSPAPAPLIDRAVKLVAERERTVRLTAIELDNTRKERDDLIAAKKKYTDDNASLTAKLDGAIKALSDAQAAMETKKKEEIKTFETAAGDMRKEAKRVTTKEEEFLAEKQKLDETLTNLKKQVEIMREQRDEYLAAKKGTFANNPPHGTILSRRGGADTVEIDLGSAVGLKEGQTFQVQPAETRTQGLAARKKTYYNAEGKLVVSDEEVAKGAIEVVQVLGPNLSTARIVSETDKVRESILKGDLLYNPLWRKGAKDHVVLFGIFDTNADGTDDIKEVAANLEKRGVIVDGYYDLSARKWASLDPKNRTPGPTQNTTYAVAGWRPNAGTSYVAGNIGELNKAIELAEDEAKSKGSQVIKAQVFFRNVGYETSRNIGDDNVNAAALKYVKESGIVVPGGDK
jgi:hypothetical protein